MAIPGDNIVPAWQSAGYQPAGRMAGGAATHKQAGGAVGYKSTGATSVPMQAARDEATHFDTLVRRADDNRTAGRNTASAVEKSNASHQTTNATEDGEKSEGGFLAFLKAVIDVINPLQHIPVISTIYRHITGDEISPMARIAGDTLYGGPIGAAMGVVNVALEEHTGKDMGDTVLAMVTPSKNTPSQNIQPGTQTSAPIMLAAADIIWDTPAPDMQQNSDQHGTMLAALDPSEIPSSVPPTHLRTRMNGTEPAQSLPYAPPVHPTKIGMLAPTQTAPAVSGAEFITAPDDVGKRNTATHPAEKPAIATMSGPGHIPGASPVLHSQDAPAAPARKAVPSEQIALLESETSEESSKERSMGIVTPVADHRLIPMKMMEALDKYAALKQTQNRGLVSVQY